ncbi:MAG: serine--tRNA ligase, partial [Gammaproteobacteria bacterium]|nr:serine--tRNA ligase [Gammaproteobacteria bacterium]
MLDQKLLRTELETVAAKLKRRGYVLDTNAFAALEAKRKELQIKAENLQSERNTKSKGIGKAKAAGEDVAPLLAEVSSLGEKLDKAKAENEAVQHEVQQLIMGIPNLPDDSVPDGLKEEDNLEIRKWGEPTKLDFEAKDHVELGAPNDWLDFETAAKLTGSRFVVMRGGMAKLHRALTQFMLDTHSNEHGYEEVYVPYIVNADS